MVQIRLILMVDRQNIGTRPPFTLGESHYMSLGDEDYFCLLFPVECNVTPLQLA